MNIYHVTLDRNDWQRYQIYAAHRQTLPILYCDVCDTAWGTLGEAYPSLDLPDLAARYPAGHRQAVPRAEFEAIREQLRPLLPYRATVGPGAAFGPFVGTAKGKFFDFAWHEPWTAFIQAEALARLQERGVRMPRCGVPTLRFKGKAPPPELLEPEALPLLDLAHKPGTDPRETACAVCGHQPRDSVELRVDPRAELPDSVDFFRARNWPTIYLATERFAEVVHSLELTGLVLIPVEVD